jgi:hypothetical protein
MSETAEASLGELRAMVDLDAKADPNMTKFVADAVGYRDSAKVYITIDGQFVIYSIAERIDA